MTAERRSLVSVPDADLIGPLKAGDEQAFEELLRRFEGKVYGLARSVTRNESDARDALQDAFLSVYRKIGSFKEESSLSTWIYRIAVNAALMKVRRRRDDRVVSLEEAMPRYDEREHRVTGDPDWFPRGDEALLRRELREVMSAAIKDLPTDYRAVFVLRDQEGLDTREVASILELSVPAVKSRLHRARLFLRERIQSYWRDAGRCPSPQPADR